MTRQTARIAACGVHMFIIGVFGAHPAMAQTQPGLRVGSTATPPAALSSGTASVVDSSDARPVELMVGRSTLVEVGSPIARVSLTSADIADALVTGQSQLLVHGKTPGSISMFVWDRAGAVKRFEIAVLRDLARLNDQVRELFPGEQIRAHSNGKAVVLSGTVSNKDVADKVALVAAGYVEKPTDVTSLLQVQAGPRSNQVLLRVRFAEVSRSAMSEFGMSIFTSPTGINNTIGRVTTQQFPAPAYTDLAWTKANSDFGSDVTSAEGKLAFSDFLNVFLLNQRYDLGVLIKALQNRGLFQSLAEPNLVAESGKEASFLAGGEFPVPVAQGSGANIGVSVQFKEFGIRLNFTPTVNGDRVHLKVRPEVSTLDYGNAVLLSGFRIPSLQTRRAETSLELQNGQTFAIAGLMNNQMQQTMQKVPGLGDIPVLGYLFRSKASQRDQTELVVMITPEILPSNSPGVTPSIPNYPDTFLPPLSELKNPRPVPAPAFTERSRSQAVTPAGTPVADNRTEIERAQDRAMASIDQQNPQAAAATAVAPQAVALQTAAQPVAAQAAQAADPASAAWKQADADAQELSKEQRQLEKAAREQAARDAKAAEKARKEEAQRAEKAQAEADKLAREQATRDAEAARVQAKRDAEAARVQAKRDAEAAKLQVKRDEEAAKLQARLEAEAARKQAEEAEIARRQAEAAKNKSSKADPNAAAEAQRQAVIAAAEAQRQAALAAYREAERAQEERRAAEAASERLRTSEAEYQSELARRSQR
jgi:pilus assembly protein CpaC